MKNVEWQRLADLAFAARNEIEAVDEQAIKDREVFRCARWLALAYMGLATQKRKICLHPGVFRGETCAKCGTFLSK